MKNFVILLLSGVHLIKHIENQQIDLATIHRFQKHVAAFYNMAYNGNTVHALHLHHILSPYFISAIMHW